jgi:Zinc dependent phospholipase C
MRRMKALINKILWAIPISFYALDANAWGLYTHIYFSQYLLLAAPLLGNKVLGDKALTAKIQLAVKKFPNLVLAGACLPDLAIISKAFNTTHQWRISEQMLAAARTDQEIAIAVGYTSHLFVDVIAHNHFVPAHEAKWVNKTILTHIASEWAMDAYVAKQLNHRPHQLIRLHLVVLSEFVAPIFNVPTDTAKTNLKRLAFWDQLLRITHLSPMILWALKKRDLDFIKNLNYYLAKTEHALSHFHHALQGKRPNWEPELNNLNVDELIAWREQCLGDLRLHMLNPVDFYHARQKAAASK